MTAMTKRKALEICRDMWKWLSEHPGKDKDAWPGMATAIEKYCEGDEMANDCPCCEFKDQSFGDGDCGDCPMKYEWGLSKEFADWLFQHTLDAGICENPQSPYHLWHEADTPYEHKKYARKIYLAAKRALRNL